MQIFRGNFYKPLRLFYFWSDDFLTAIARFLLCTLAFSLLVKKKRFQLPNLAIFLFLIYTKMVNKCFFGYRTAIQEDSDYF